MKTFSLETTEIKLTELNPHYASGDGVRLLLVTCPQCGEHEIGIQIVGDERNQRVWDVEGDSFENMTISPSVASMSTASEQYRKQQFIYDPQAACQFHFYIKNGYAIDVR